MLKRAATWAVDLLTQLPCLLRGHDAVQQRAEREWFLRCNRCGRRSNGWQLPAVSLQPAAVPKRRAVPVIPYHYMVPDPAPWMPLAEVLEATTPMPAAELLHWDRGSWVARDDRRIVH